MKYGGLFAFLVHVALLGGSYVAVVKLAWQVGQYLAQFYILIPALSALVTGAIFNSQKFKDSNLRTAGLVLLPVLSFRHSNRRDMHKRVIDIHIF